MTMKHCTTKFTRLFAAGPEGTCRIARHRVTMDEAEMHEALGNWERVYDTYSGELMGFRMKAQHKDDSDVKSAGHSPAAISTEEMQINCTRSRSNPGIARRGLGSVVPEVIRLQREKDGLPAEDRVERVQCKILVWPNVGAAKKDILRVWPA